MSKKKTILLIEDDVVLLEMYEERLRKANFIVKIAKAGEEGLKTLKKEKADLILLDLRLPGISGFQVLEKIRKDEKFKDLPVVIFSVLGKSEDRARGHELGASGYLVKAETMPGEVVERVKKLIS